MSYPLYSCLQVLCYPSMIEMTLGILQCLWISYLLSWKGRQVQIFRMVLDPQLTFTAHNNYLKSKTYSKIKLLGKLRNIVDLNTSLMMHKTLVLPIYDYCDFLLIRITNQDAEFLQKLQNCAFRSILRVDRLTPTNQTHETLNMDTLQVRWCRHVAIQMYKYLHGDAPPECTNMFNTKLKILKFALNWQRISWYLFSTCFIDYGM